MPSSGKCCNVVGVHNCYFDPKCFLEDDNWGPLGLTLKRIGLTSCISFFCIIHLEDNIYQFVMCPTVHAIWKYLLEIWQILS